MLFRGRSNRSLPLGARIVFVGDSNSQNGFTLQNWTRQILATTGGKVFCPPGGNIAAAGTSSSYGVSHISDVVAMQPRIVAVMYGTNDGSDTAATKANLRAMYNAYLGAGAKVLAIGIPPSRKGVISSTTADVNAWIATQADVKYVRTDNLTGAATTGAEDVHITVEQQISLAGNVRAAMAPWLSASGIYDNDVVSLIDATFAGTAGVNSGGFAGTIPTGWSGYRSSGTGTATVSKVTQNGATAVQIDYSGQGTFNFSRSDPVSFTTANYFDSWAEAKWSGAAPDVLSFTAGGRPLFETYGSALNISELGTVQVYRPESAALGSSGSTVASSWLVLIPAGGSGSLTISRQRTLKR